MEKSIHSIFSLEGKVALVTGASKGLGKVIALAYAEAGAKVVVSARSEDLLEDVVSEIKSKGGEGLAIKCDVSKDQDLFDLVKTAMDHFNRIDILVNNAGISPYVKYAVDVTREMWEKIFNVNMMAPFILTREVGKIMIKQNYGRVINMASAGGLVGMAGQVAYASMKGALIQMTRSLAIEWAKDNITVNALAPSILATDLTAGVMKSEQYSKALLQRVPMGTFGKAGDVVGAALFFASEGSAYTTGMVLPIDGGLLAS
jgi:NAD(P)-dependent dehydrogenase (short-subunit alcohol dehydrogenase family)